MERTWTDEKLQELFERDPQAFFELARTNKDAELYAVLFSTLPRLDDMEVPSGIGERVVAQLEVQQTKAKKWQYLAVGVTIGLTLMAGLLLSWVLSPEMAAAVRQLSAYLPLLATGAVVLFGIEILDQKLIWRGSEKAAFE